MNISVVHRSVPSHNPLNILHVIVGLGSGGAEATLFRVVTQGSHDFRHVVVSLTTSGVYGSRLKARGVPVYCLNSTGLLGLPLTVHRLSRLVKKLRPDVVHTWMYHSDLMGGIVSRMQGIPTVWCVRSNSAATSALSISRRILLRLCGLASSFIPTSIVYCSRAAVLPHACWGYNQRRSVVIPNGYEVNRLVRNNAEGQTWRIRNKIPKHVPLLGMIARWHPHKNHEMLLRALQRLNSFNPGPWLCVLAGSGLDESNRDLATLLEQYGVESRVKLVGHQADVIPLMSALDLHLLTSVTEGFPNVVAESMLCEVPAIATDVGDAAFIIGETGWVVPSGRFDLFADAIQAALHEKTFQPDLWLARRNACRQRIATNFNISTTIEQYETVWMDAAFGKCSTQQPLP